LASSYGSACAGVRDDRDSAQTHLRDYQAHFGTPLPPNAFFSRLTFLRDELNSSLSGAGPGPGAQPLSEVAELAEEITSLNAVQTIEAAPP
jgi:hypothetical protein